MGLSLQETPISQLVKLIYRIDNRKYKRDFKNCHYFEDVVEIITHPYIYQFNDILCNNILDGIKNDKIIDIRNEQLSKSSPFFENLFDLKSSLIHCKVVFLPILAITVIVSPFSIGIFYL